ncbi:MAG: peptide chain release factor 1 [Phycisphaerales bacterium]|nr:MAG: peptide chain release factor 1 [Phycisphaerales bacterium]
MSTTTDAIAPALKAKLDELLEQYRQVGRQLEDPDVLADHERVRELSIRRAALAPAVEAYQRYTQKIDEAGDLRQVIEQAEDRELVEMARQELPEVLARAAEHLEQAKAALVSSDDQQIGAVILEVRAGTGGDEAQLWAADLLAMYEKYASRKGWSFETLDFTPGEGHGGIRSASVSVKGQGVWAELAFEAGVHSVKRVPATEAQGRIHTSTATVAVLPEPKAVQVKIDWANDVIEHVTTAQGPGGQNVNKVATAVHLVHVPTGIEVRMQESKSQHQNREKARRLLMARLYERQLREQQAQRAAERKGQIGTGERSEKVRVYRYQDGIVADQRLDTKYHLRQILFDGDLSPIIDALSEQRTAERLSQL